MILVLSAPSGAGKSTLSRELLKMMPEIVYSVSVTTRPPRAGEVDGKEYHFLTDEEFEARKNSNELIEYAQVHGYWYGTLRSSIEEVRGSGRDILLDVDVQGGSAIKAIFPDTLLIFIAPPSFAELESRLRLRKQDDEQTIKKRLEAFAQELSRAKEYDYVVLNEKVPVALEQLRSIILAERARLYRNQELFAGLQASLPAANLK